MKHEIFGVKIDDIPLAGLLEILSDDLASPSFHLITTLNPEFLLQAREDEEFYELLHKADLALPDGVGMRFAIAALTPNLLQHRHTGTDTLFLLAKLCTEKGKTLGLVGGLPGSAEKAAVFLKTKFPSLRVFGFDPGVVELGDPCLPALGRGGMQEMPPPAKKGVWGGIMTRLRNEAPDVLAVGLGQKKQEFFLCHVAPLLPSLRIGIGVGGAFDVQSGTIARAPAWMSRSGLEWVWRLAQEPKRFRRIWNAILVFPAAVVWSTLKHRIFLRAFRRAVPEIFRQVFHKEEKSEVGN